MRPKVNTQKHYVQNSLFAVSSGAIVNKTIISAVAAPTAVNEVREGATVSAVYIEMWLSSDDAAAGTAIVTLEKLQAGVASMTAAQSALLNDYLNKRNIFYTQMGLLPSNVDYPMAVVKGWMRIPKGKQRFALGDKLKLNLHGQSNGLAACGFYTYKEQF